MKKTLGAFVALTAFGCEQEYTFSGEVDAAGVPNPPNLETPVKVDIITQVTTPKVDILWVVDDSGSMAEEQAQLIESFPAFMAYFLDSGLDWHVGVVSTDMQDPSKSGKLQGAAGLRYLDSSSPNPIDLFGRMARLGTNGSSDEMGRRAVFRALTDPMLTGFNDGFYRDEASLSIIVISDEPDYSDNNPTSNEFITFLNSLKQDPEDLNFSSVVAPVQGCATASYPGTDYIQVTNGVGGIFESICTDDWVPILEALGLQAAGLRREFFLSEVPVPGTIKVSVEDAGFVYEGIDHGLVEAGQDPDDLCPTESCFEFTYDSARNSVGLVDFIPTPLAKVRVEYQLLSEYEPKPGDDLF